MDSSAGVQQQQRQQHLHDASEVDAAIDQLVRRRSSRELARKNSGGKSPRCSKSPKPQRRRSNPDVDDEEGRSPRPRMPKRSYSKEEWERSLALVQRITAREEAEQEQMDISLAMRLMDASLKHNTMDASQERRDIEFARRLMDASLQEEHQYQYMDSSQERRDIEFARSILDESLTREQKDREFAMSILDESAQREERDLEFAKAMLEETDPKFDLNALIREMEDESRARRHRAPPVPLEQLLQPCQKKAVEYVQERAKEMHHNALPTLLVRITEDLGFEPEDLEKCLQYIQDDAPIIVHISHEALKLVADDTHYRNLFETSTSGGNRNKNKRQNWESTMFGNCYDETCPPFDRPKYGCLNVTGDLAGVRSAHRYGTCYLTLREHVRARATFFDKDTGGFVEEKTLATNQHYAHILNSYNDSDLYTALSVVCSARVEGARSSMTSMYKEVQIHGPLALAKDIQALTIPGRERDADDDFRKVVEKFQRKTGCNVLWQMDLLEDSFVISS